MSDSDWTAGEIARFRVLWDEGMSTAQIGVQLGRSKNSIVGKAHRLDFPPRPSPIRRGGVSRVARKRVHPPRLTLPSLSSVSITVPATPQGAGERAAQAAVQAAPRVPERSVAPRPLGGGRSDGQGCRFITVFDDRRPGKSLFCGQPVSSPGSSWCAACREMVFVRVPVQLRHTALTFAEALRAA